jgi:phosphoglycerol transferase MdoB-like AlkP superfamily enzyme
MTLYRFLFFFNYHGANRPFSGSAFLLGMRYDARVVSILGLLMMLLMAVPFLNPMKNKSSHKFWNAFIGLVFIVFLIFYSTDFYYYDYLKQRLNASVLNFLVDAKISFGMMWQTYPMIKMLIAFIFALSVFIFWHHRRLKSISETKAPEQSNKMNVLIYVIFVLILSGFTFGRLSQYPLRWSDAFAFTDDFKASTSLNPFQSFMSSLQFRNSGYDIKKVKKSYPIIADYIGISKPDSINLNYTRNFVFDSVGNNQPNIVLVICESFSAYKSSMFGNKLNPTPYFNQMCNEGVFFERCFTPAFGTARGVWATITGIPDVEPSKTASRNPLAVDQHTIINDFKGYEKFYFLGGSTTWANIRGLLKNNITDLNIYEQENFTSSKVDVWGISDKNLFLESNKILSKQKKPFFAIIQTADNHRPYTIPEEDLKAFNKVDYLQDTLMKYGFDDNGQYNAFRYTDFNFKQFIEAAKKEVYFKNTIFVFVGDHGLRGNAGNQFPESFSKQEILAEHVPLLFYAPSLLAPKKIRKVASQLDVLPSIATLAKRSYTNTTLGRNLFDTTTIAKQRFSFIADPEIKNIALVSNEFYYSRSLINNATTFVSVINNDSVPQNAYMDSIKKRMSTLVEAWYETSKYLLLNNKKKN